MILKFIITFVILIGRLLASEKIIDFGQLSDENLINTPLIYQENREFLEDELFNRQIRETRFHDLDFETTHWRMNRLEAVLNNGRTFED